MPVFQYVARNNRGQMVRGALEAQNQNAVARALREQGLIPTNIEAGSAAKSKQRQAGKGGKIKLDDLVIMTRQFATMIRAGLPLLEVLRFQDKVRVLGHFRGFVDHHEGPDEAGRFNLVH